MLSYLFPYTEFAIPLCIWVNMTFSGYRLSGYDKHLRDAKYTSMMRRSWIQTQLGRNAHAI